MATIIEKILASHAGHAVKPGDLVDVEIDVRVARDFGGANVVKNIEERGLGIADATKTFFTFDCNPGGSDQKYATNQHRCRRFAREHAIPLYDISSGIGTHLAIDEGLVGPGMTFISTDSHANIMGSIGAFGQGMGDQDIAAAFARGKVWFKVPKSMKVILEGQPTPEARAKDIVLACLKHFGAAGLLGYSAEFYGPVVDGLGLAERITISSMATEMGGIIAIFPPNEKVLSELREVGGEGWHAVYADEDALYERVEHVDIGGLQPQIARPGHPEDVVNVAEVAGRKIDSGFIGSCTNGRFEDLAAAAKVLAGRKLAPGVVLKIVPSTDEIWQRCLKEGLFQIFKDAGALVGNAGCAGCAAGQIGQNGPGEVTVSTGNRNYAGKQGKGEVYLASPETVAASCVAGVICTASSIPAEPAVFQAKQQHELKPSEEKRRSVEDKAKRVRGRAWVIPIDNIDTDMIFHNRYLAITDQAEMGQYTFDNLAGWKDFAQHVKAGDIVFVGGNFGAGSSRQQAVDCFLSLGVAAIVGRSFGAIYERNAMNAGFPILNAPWQEENFTNGDEVEVDFETGLVTNLSRDRKAQGEPFADVQMAMYQQGGLLAL